MKILSHRISNNTPQYAGKKEILLRQTSSIASGDSCNKFRLEMDLHTGTHIDYPLHFCNKGKSQDDLENYGLMNYENWFLVDVDVASKALIESIDLSKVPKNIECLLIRTGWEKIRENDPYRYAVDGPGLHSTLSKKLRRSFPNIQCVGFDFISLTSYNHRKQGRIAHKSFLCEEQILIIEDMKLNGILGMEGDLYIVPLLIKGVDGVPVTVFLK